LALAAGIAFYSLVALFPAITAGVSVYAFFANAATISKHLSISADIVPAGTLDLLGEEISRIAAKSDGKLTFGFLLGLGIALFAGKLGVKFLLVPENVRNRWSSSANRGAELPAHPQQSTRIPMWPIGKP
jgi:membrane protein